MTPTSPALLKREGPHSDPQTAVIVIVLGCLTGAGVILFYGSILISQWYHRHKRAGATLPSYEQYRSARNRTRNRHEKIKEALPPWLRKFYPFRADQAQNPANLPLSRVASEGSLGFVGSAGSAAGRGGSIALRDLAPPGSLRTPRRGRSFNRGRGVPASPLSQSFGSPLVGMLTPPREESPSQEQDDTSRPPTSPRRYA
ncbi:MAG: hypothetical protein M1831_003595 [Alyxoria varia]|nr:MAG: hypothetical protein M1831_003595 [Alyxoria varia]